MLSLMYIFEISDILIKTVPFQANSFVWSSALVTHIPLMQVINKSTKIKTSNLQTFSAISKSKAMIWLLLLQCHRHTLHYHYPL